MLRAIEIRDKAKEVLEDRLGLAFKIALDECLRKSMTLFDCVRALLSIHHCGQRHSIALVLDSLGEPPLLLEASDDGHHNLQG
jgi:hypothetical protein